MVKLGGKRARNLHNLYDTAEKAAKAQAMFI